MATKNINKNNLLQQEHVEIIDSSGNSVRKDILLIQETTLNVFLKKGSDQEFISSVVCLPDKLDELVVGILFGKNLINAYSDIESITYETAKNISAHVQLANRNVACFKEVSQNGVLPQEYKAERILELANIFARDTILHRQTNATHSCLLADDDNIYISVEDTGRHNTLDKAIGYALINNINRSNCMLFTSGRISPEMVCKTVNADIPILIGKSVPTALAADLARANRLTLIGHANAEHFYRFT